MKQCFNYKKIFDDPIRVRKFGKLSLPMAVPVNRIILSVVILLFIFTFFKHLITWINSILPGIKFVLYLGLPYYISGIIVHLNPDGQKLHWYLIDISQYYFFIRLPNKIFFKDEMIEKLTEIKVGEYEYQKGDQ